MNIGEQFGVEDVLAFNVTAEGEQRYLVKWRGEGEARWKEASELESYWIWQFWEKTAKDIQIAIGEMGPRTRSQAIRQEVLETRFYLDVGNSAHQKGILLLGEKDYDFDKCLESSDEGDIEEEGQSAETESMEEESNCETAKPDTRIWPAEFIVKFDVTESQQQRYFIIPHGDTSNGFWKDARQMGHSEIMGYWEMINSVINNLEDEEAPLTEDEKLVKAEHEKAFELSRQLREKGIKMVAGYDDS